ncbi:MAG: LamG domain-containing protein [Kofleriaceae bacterium]
MPGDGEPDTHIELSISGQVGYWSFDEGSGTVALEANLGPSLGLVNGVTWVPGVVGTAVSADGVDDYLQAGAIDLSGRPTVTVTLWVRRTYSMAENHVLLEVSPDFNTSTTGFGIYPDNLSPCIGVFVGMVGNVDYSTRCYGQPSSGVWHHFAIIYDKSTADDTITTYIDGAVQTSSLDNLNDNTNAFGVQPIFLFSRNGMEEFAQGVVDELRIFNRGLTPAEVQAVFDER